MRAPQPRVFSAATMQVIVAAFVILELMQMGRILDVWTTGAFHDTDDAMRMAQVRDLLAGQAWSDLVAHRLSPPEGMLTHWSRVIDVPLVLLVRMFGLFLAPESAERAARLAFPALLLGGLLSVSAQAAASLYGRDKAFWGVIAVSLCGVVTWQFPPGRIDHHAPQILLLVAAFAALAQSFDPARARCAAWAGAAIALSLGISIENLPFIVVLAATPPLAFAARGAQARGQLVAFACGLAPTLALVFVATVPPARWLVPARDALSIIHLVAGLAGAAACLVLARLDLAKAASRLAAVALAGGGALGLTLLLFPSALRDPLAEMDPALRRFWLEQLMEAEPFFAHLRREPADGLSWLLPVIFGFSGVIVGFWRGAALSRSRFLLLGALASAGFLSACWEMRVISSTAPLLGLASLALVAPARDALSARNPAFAGPLALLAGLVLLSQQGAANLLALAPAGQSHAAAQATARPKTGCLTSSSFRPLADLAPGLVLAQIDPGAYILAHTSHSVIAGPYHRNNRGNLLSLRAFTAAPDAAEQMIRASGARWVFLCRARDGDLDDLVALAPDGLAARLARNEPPSWLKATPLGDTPYLAFEVMQP